MRDVEPFIFKFTSIFCCLPFLNLIRDTKITNLNLCLVISILGLTKSRLNREELLLMCAKFYALHFLLSTVKTHQQGFPSTT